MAKVDRFEDLIAWHKARVLCREVYTTTRQGSFARDFGLCSQIQRSAVSVMLNIAEGFERMHLKEFHQHLNTAKGSCAELRAGLYIALDIGYIDQSTFDRLMGLAHELARVVGGLRSSIADKITS